jgi:hypothetical protein
LTSPLIYPFFAIANMVVGVIVFIFITGVGIHYTGVLYSDYRMSFHAPDHIQTIDTLQVPVQDSLAWDNTGNTYNVSRILTPELTLDENAYKGYSPLFLSTNFGLCYGVAFASYIAIIVHTFLYNGSEIWERYKLARRQPADVHLRLMRQYKDSPEWWYLIIFIVLLALGFVTCLFWDTHLTVCFSVLGAFDTSGMVLKQMFYQKWWAFLISSVSPQVVS